MGKKPQVLGIMLLRCPYCLESPLRKHASWFEFAPGCPNCGYKYEREEGYFLGAPWMISYPVIGILCLFISVFSYQSLMNKYGSLGFGAFLASLAIILGLGFYPYARAIWMVGDHLLHPLSDKERSEKGQL